MRSQQPRLSLRCSSLPRSSFPRSSFLTPLFPPANDPTWVRRGTEKTEGNWRSPGVDDLRRRTVVVWRRGVFLRSCGCFWCKIKTVWSFSFRWKLVKIPGFCTSDSLKSCFFPWEPRTSFVVLRRLHSKISCASCGRFGRGAGRLSNSSKRFKQPCFCDLENSHDGHSDGKSSD